MIITCARCATSYSLDAIDFGMTDRKVRCSNCGHQWTQPPPQINEFVESLAQRKSAVSRTPETLAPPAAEPPGDDVRNEQMSTESPPDAEPVAATRTKSDVATGDAPQPTEQAAEKDIEPPQEASPDSDAAQPVGVPEAAPESAPMRAEAPTLPSEQPLPSTPPVDSAEKEPPHTSPTPSPLAEAPPDTPSLDGSPLETPPIEAPTEKQTNRALAIALIAASIILFAAGALVVARDFVIEHFPGASGIYKSVFESVGFGVKIGTGLDIHDVTFVREHLEGREILIVAGTITNVSETSQQLPVIKVALFDLDDEELRFTTVKLPSDTLDPHESTEFEAEITDPPAAARRIRVNFVRDSDQSQNTSH